MKDKENKSTFDVLKNLNVNDIVKEKNGFKFLSWSSALDRLLTYYPDTSWEVREWDGLPYLQTKAGCFVEVSVTVQNITRKQLHPVLDYRNKPIPSPNAFEINTSLQRALAKAISLHGLGLYIYQGEDLPMSEKEAISEARVELTDLLKMHGKYGPETHKHICAMNMDQLQAKIAEYREKESK